MGDSWEILGEISGHMLSNGFKWDKNNDNPEKTLDILDFSADDQGTCRTPTR